MARAELYRDGDVLVSDSMLHVSGEMIPVSKITSMHTVNNQVAQKRLLRLIAIGSVLVAAYGWLRFSLAEYEEEALFFAIGFVFSAIVPFAWWLSNRQEGYSLVVQHGTMSVTTIKGSTERIEAIQQALAAAIER